ncbi:MAG: hypothetical protein D6683_07475 [Actinomyces sp.]|nr:MAG: hypothetical protein D6683_07475 [Actinomyces sp.]
MSGRLATWRRALTVGEVAGAGIVRASWWGTGLFSVTALVGAALQGVWRWPAVLVSVVLFAVGCVVFVWAFLVAVERSRHELIGIGGLYFLTGSAPASVRRHLMASLGVQIVVALVTASVRVFTTAAFGTLVPMYGLALAGLWGARHGTFPPRHETGGPGPGAGGEAPPG